MEPTKHQYDYDAATVHGFLVRNGLEGEYRANIEANHATLAGHSFHHEVAYATANGMLGSIDANRGDPQNGWDTDQFPNSVEDLVLPIYEILRHGGIAPGGFNFDAKLRRQSTDRNDLFHAHIGALDTLARALLAAADLFERGELAALRDQRYAGWDGELGKAILDGSLDLAELEARVADGRIDPRRASGAPGAAREHRQPSASGPRTAEPPRRAHHRARSGPSRAAACPAPGSGRRARRRAGRPGACPTRTAPPTSPASWRIVSRSSGRPKMTSVETEKLGSRIEWTWTSPTVAPRASRRPSVSAIGTRVDGRAGPAASRSASSRAVPLGASGFDALA